jgi:hypothetical protein
MEHARRRGETRAAISTNYSSGRTPKHPTILVPILGLVQERFDAAIVLTFP